MKKKRLMITLLLVISIFMFVGFAYAYLAAGVNNNKAQEASITTGTMNLTFADGTTVLNATQMTIGESVTKTFTIENTGTLDATASMYFKDLVNTYMIQSMTYKLEQSTSENGVYKVLLMDTNVPQSSSVSEKLLYGQITVPAGTKLYYKLIITFNNLPNVDQTDDMNAVLNTNFTLKAGHVSESALTLASLGLENQVKEEPTSYNMFNYTWDGYQFAFDDEAASEWGIKVDGVGETQGIYSMEDDFGMSYYFRGPKTLNNIVKFGKYDTDMYYYMISNRYGDNVTGDLSDCQSGAYRPASDCTDTYKYASAGDDMYWRIVRINGDGTLRLMYIGTSATAEKNAGRSPFNRTDDSLGYTYNNSSPDAGDGTSSRMKTYLETWYSKNMNSEDDNIAFAQFYNDTTKYYPDDADLDNFLYSTQARLNKYNRGETGYTNEVSPTLKTSTTTETYGGRYYLKVGLINADEIVLSGVDGILGTHYVSSSYTDVGDSWYYTMSPNSADDMISMYASNNVLIDNMGFSTGLDVFPVINLTKEYARSLVWDSANGYYVAN